MFSFQLIEDMELETYCAGRCWTVHLCSTQDLQGAKDGLNQISSHLLQTVSGENQIPHQALHDIQAIQSEPDDMFPKEALQVFNHI